MVLPPPTRCTLSSTCSRRLSRLWRRLSTEILAIIMVAVAAAKHLSCLHHSSKKSSLRLVMSHQHSRTMLQVKWGETRAMMLLINALLSLNSRHRLSNLSSNPPLPPLICINHRSLSSNRCHRRLQQKQQRQPNRSRRLRLISLLSLSSSNSSSHCRKLSHCHRRTTSRSTTRRT